MSSTAITLLPRLRFTLRLRLPALRGRAGRANEGLLQDDAWKAIAFAVDNAAADVLPMSASDTGDAVAGSRVLASLIGGHFLLKRVHQRNEQRTEEAWTRRERRQRRRASEELHSYLKAFEEAIAYARRIADGEPAGAELPMLLQDGPHFPLVQRFRQDRQVLAETRWRPARSRKGTT
ncbi:MULTISPECIES: hypothetical protein [Streptomyces]|uniref:Uncharacterized protein n=1 Tax=Streptomyces griseiscabiei TaxID=2993540 RepID=A0ABU4LKW8_9ACTN|nr:MULTISPECIES: hypothetical protein [Streptomyces]MBZ3908544.1 hypothetical protein [Streptomyces griseiscabiei]MDX2916075.1 hypothetical protein [Streptomyces griseiscabiei]